MAKKKIMLKAETHYGSIELPMTDAQALKFSKKLLNTHKREQANWRGYNWYKLPWWKKQNIKRPTQGIEPFLKLEFIEIES